MKIARQGPTWPACYECGNKGPGAKVAQVYVARTTTFVLCFHCRVRLAVTLLDSGDELDGDSRTVDTEVKP